MRFSKVGVFPARCSIRRALSLCGAIVPTVLLCASALARPQAAAQDAIWLEGEGFSASNIAKPNISGWGRPEYLSGEKWMQVSIDADKVEKELPGGGGLLTYAFTVGRGHEYEIWNRIGYEFVRSPFQWRIDGGNWQTIAPEQRTTDLMELQDWNEVAWLKMGTQNLTPGAHKLEIHLPQTKDDKGQTARVLYASDALCLTPGPFHPNGRNKPGTNSPTKADAEAAGNVFNFAEKAGLSSAPSVFRFFSSLPLKGLWEICRNDEDLPTEVAAPIKDFPVEPHWSAIQVPGDKNALRPDLAYAHRVWYRTRVNVPADVIAQNGGRSFQITFPQNNLNTTVYVNGVYCGFSKNPYARCTFDITPGMKAGVNEVWVGIKDAWYGYSASPKNPMKLRKVFNLPLSFTHNGFQDLAYPIWNGFQSGILGTPELIVSGSSYAADVFVRPSVSKKQLAVDVTVKNATNAAASGEIVCEAVNAKTGKVEKTLVAKPYSLASGAEQTVTLSEAWENPLLWWPGVNPNMYTLRTTIKQNGKTIDVKETPFGFREWGAKGRDFTLNGVVWHLWADLQPGATPQEFLANYRATHQKDMRYMGVSQNGVNWMGLEPTAALDFFDTNGVVVRRCGPLDGEAIGYNAIENDPDLKALYKSDIKMDLMQNWRDQMVAQVKGERNHPSVMLWSLENEWLFINCINLYGGLMDQFEAEVKKCSDAVQQADPTRLTMTDGGGANKDQSMPVHGNHYVFDLNGKYPDLAYEVNPLGGGRGRWVWDEKRPRFIGEDYFATGINPFDYAYFGGEETFGGKAQSHAAMALVYRILTEGYRWAGQSAWHHWVGPDDMDAGREEEEKRRRGEEETKNRTPNTEHQTPRTLNPYLSHSPRAVFCRQWDWTFGSGQKVKRTLGIFNDTHDADPITLTWTLTVGGKKVQTNTSTHTVAPGHNEKFDVTLDMPTVNARTEGAWTLTLTEDGKQAFQDSKAISVLNTRPRSQTAQAEGLGKLGAKNLFVFDPNGSVGAFLKANGLAFTGLASLKTLPDAARVLVVGKDALDVTESGSSRLAAFASEGRTVIVLEQKNPLKYTALPAEMEPAVNEGRTAFAEDMDHPVFAGLKQKDFFTWGGDEVVYRNAYQKPTRGGKSLVQCDMRLADTALAEIPTGTGLLLVSQLLIGEKLNTNATAQQLLINLLAYGAQYKLTYRPVVAVVGDATLLGKTLDAISLNYSKSGDAVQAIATPGSKIALVEATPANLKLLADNSGKVNAFTNAGGWLFLHGLTPEGLAEYNKLVGVDHMIRPFWRERVAFPAQKSPLTAGLTTGDIVMRSGKKMFNYNSDEWVADDTFTYCVDYDDVAPFGKFANDFHRNMVSGMVSADGWPYIIDLPQKDASFPIQFPKPQTITHLRWVGNKMYNPPTRIALLTDGGQNLPLDVKPTDTPQEFDLPTPLTGKEITLKITDVERIKDTEITGLDNISLIAKRSPDFYQKVKPLLNVGALMAYPRGNGGILLCNLKLQDSEAVPENGVKKRTILATLLRNLKAPFAGKTVIAGAKLAYQTVDIGKFANQYRDERGWFGDKQHTFAGLPTGKQTFGNVPYQIYDFPTSPVPTAIMLNGQGIPNNVGEEVKGIPVGRKADALFFLQTARIDNPLNDQEKRERKQYELFKYVVHYADGQTLEIPQYQDSDVANFTQTAPAALPGAQIAWTRKYENGTESAVAYSKQWNNPRPNVAIASVDVVYGKDKRGVPALLAITAASAQ